MVSAWLLMLSIAFSSAVLGSSWALGDPIVVEERHGPTGSQKTVGLSLTAGSSTVLLSWTEDVLGAGSNWLAMPLSFGGVPLRGEPLRIPGLQMQIVARDRGFAGISVEGPTLSLRFLDLMGDVVAGPVTLYETAGGFHSIAAASNGSEVVVVWAGRPLRYDILPAIHGAMIHPDGRIESGIVREGGTPPPLLSHARSTLLSVASNGIDFLVAWADCEKLGTRFFTSRCSVDARAIQTGGTLLLPATALLEPETLFQMPLGGTTSDGSNWQVMTHRGLFVISSDGRRVARCANGEEWDQVDWDGEAFIGLRQSEVLRVARLSAPCMVPLFETVVPVAGTISMSAIASSGRGITLLAYAETIAEGDEQKSRIVVRRMGAPQEGRRRAVTRGGFPSPAVLP